MSDRRSPRNMCSVRHRPMPCAPSRRARSASSAVSALARTASRRTESAWDSSRSTAFTRSAVSSSVPVEGGLQAALDVRLGRRRHHCRRAEEDLAGGPVDGEHVALVDHDACRSGTCGSAMSTSISSAPQTQVLPMPRATTAACDVLPPRAVRMPFDAIMPTRSSGLVSRRTSTTSSPRSAHSFAVGESNTARPTAAPGEAAIPRVSSSGFPLGSNCGNISWASCAPDTRDSASSRVISCSSTSCDAIRNAAPRECACRPGSAASTACRARW